MALMPSSIRTSPLIYFAATFPRSFKRVKLEGGTIETSGMTVI
jgi:hypothetical protein